LLIETKKIKPGIHDASFKTQVLPTYENITNIAHIHMKKSMHINESLPVTITVQKRTEKQRGGGRVICGHDDHVGYIYKFIQ
jgi:hypothetical protein